MSQFGMLGAALKGWDYEKIVEFYYPGATVGTYTTQPNITVDGYGSMSTEDYVAGAGEGTRLFLRRIRHIIRSKQHVELLGRKKLLKPRLWHLDLTACIKQRGEAVSVQMQDAKYTREERIKDGQRMLLSTRYFFNGGEPISGFL